MDTIVLFGDSLTQFSFGPQGISTQLAHHFQRRFDVISRGFSGYNTTWAHQFASRSLPDPTRIGLAIFWYGANDCLLPPLPRAVPVEQFIVNYRKLIDLVPDQTPIVLVSPPAHSTVQRLHDLGEGSEPRFTPDRDRQHSIQYDEAVRDLTECLNTSTARKGRVAFCDIRTPMEASALRMAPRNIEKGLQFYLYDEVHLSAPGYQIAFDQVLRTIQERFPEIEAHVPLFPDFTDVDHANPEKFFAEMQ